MQQVLFTFISTCALFLAAFSITQAGEPIEIARGTTPNHPQQPQIAVDDSGTVHVAFGMNGRALYARSSRGSKSFEQPVELPSAGVMSLGMRRGPRIAIAGDAICITVIGGTQGKGRDGDVLAFCSVDGGKTWNGPAIVNDIPSSAREGLHAMAVGPDSQLCCVWLDLRSKKTEIFAATSADKGASWGKNKLVYRSPDGSVCECCHPSVAFDANGDKGKLYVMWRNSVAGARDMYLASSVDGGNTFGNASKLGAGTWPLKACPMDGGHLAISPRGDVTTAWRRENQIYVHGVSGEERLVGTGRQPWVASSSAGPCLVWIDQRFGKLFCLPPDAKQPLELANGANDPVIATAPKATGTVVIAWEERHGDEVVLLCERISMMH